MTEAAQFPVIVRCPTRFAVVVPGNPYPIEVISSGESIGDLVGFYSLRQAGLESIISRPRRLRIPFIDFLTKLSEGDSGSVPSTTITSVDTWMGGEMERDSLISLIFDIGDDELAERTIARFEKEVKHQLRVVGEAYERGATNEIKYIGQMLASILTQLNRQIVVLDRRRRKNRQLLVNTLTTYVVIIVTIAGLLFMRKFLFL
jgi:hypothetical protein